MIFKNLLGIFGPKGGINREILRLAIPNILSNISVPLISTMDTWLMGNLSNLHLNAVGLGSMIFNLIYWNIGFLRVSTTGMTAQAYGRNDKFGIGLVFNRTFLLAFIISIILLVFQSVFFEVCQNLMYVDDQQYPLIKEYFTIRMYAAPATLIMYGMMGWFFGMQNAIIPLILTIFINVCNLIISWYLVHVTGWEVAGVAWGTVAAQYLGLVLTTVILFYSYGTYMQRIQWKIILKWNELKAYFKVNIDFFIRSLCLTAAFFFFYSQSSKAGEVILAANVVLLLFLNWMSYGVDGYAYAAESLVGKYVGSKEEKKLKKAVWYCLAWGGVLASIYALVYAVFGDYLLAQFTDDIETINFAKKYLWWMVLLPFIGFASYIWDGVFVGLLASRALRNTMLVAMVLYFGMYYGLGGVSYSPHVIWISMGLLLFVRGLIQTGLFIRYGKDLK